MVFQSDYRTRRTWDDERGLELVQEHARDAEIFKLLKGGVQVARFDARSEGRELTDDEKRDHPGFDRAMIWHVHSWGGAVEDPACPRMNILGEVIVEALTAHQARYGLTSIRDGKPVHAIVTVKLGSDLDATL